MFPTSWFAARWFSAPYWRKRSPPPPPPPPPPVDPDLPSEAVIDVVSVLPRGTHWRLPGRPTVWGTVSRTSVWILPAR